MYLVLSQSIRGGELLLTAYLLFVTAKRPIGGDGDKKQADSAMPEGNRGQKGYGSDTHFAPVLHLAEEMLLREAMFMRRRAVES